MQPRIRSLNSGLAAVIILSSLGWACGSPSDSPAPSVLPAPPQGEGIQLNTPQWSLEPGEERIMCLFTTVPGEPNEEMWVNRIESGMLEGSHHFLLYRDISHLLGTEFKEGWRECEMEAAVPFAGTQTEYSNETYPEGVAFKLVGGTKIALESHYINYTSETIDALATINFYTTDPASVEHQAGSFITYKSDFTVPAGAGIGNTPEDIQGMTCDVPPAPGGTKFFSLSSHMHWHGREFNAWTHDRTTGTDIEKVYTNTDWSDPARLDFEEPLVLGQNEAFRYSCHYFNDTGSDVHEGPHADDEMCMLIGSYYPVVESQFGLDGIAACLNGDLFY